LILYAGVLERIFEEIRVYGQNPTITANLVDNQFICKNEVGAEVALAHRGPRRARLSLWLSRAAARHDAGHDGQGRLEPQQAGDLCGGIPSEDKPRRYAEVNVHYTIECKGLPQEKAAPMCRPQARNCFVMQSVSSKKNLTFTLLS
jgi:hypothetical protein